MLQVNDLSLSFGRQIILDTVSFNIHPGERIGLVGRNGSGKTTLFKLILGELSADSGKLTMPKSYTVGYLRQHLSFTETTVLQEACLGLKPEEETEVWKAEKILYGLGFSEDDLYKSPAEFSGGFQVRLNLAKVLLAEPHLLLLDEPTNYLDIISIRWLTRFLQRWPNELMLITHDRDFMNSVTTHTMAIHRTKVKKIAGNTEKLFEQIALEEEVYERTRQKEQKKRDDALEFINRFRAQAARASLVQSRIKALAKMGEKKELAKLTELGFSFNPADFPAKILLRIKELSFGYTPERTLIEDLSLELGKNDRVCVIGKNGKGKSTLLRLLAGELTPTAGEINKHPACQIGYFGQTNIERLNPANTIEKELGEVRPDLRYTEVRNVCGAMMFGGDAALKEISVLSGGEKSRVSLGKILLTPTNLLLLDEPTNHLDIESCDSMIAALDAFAGAVIIVTHSEMFLHHLATKLIVFNEDRVFLFEGTYQEFLDKIGWEPAVGKQEIKQKKETTHQKNKIMQSDQNKKRKKIMAEITIIENNINEAEATLTNINKKIIEEAGNSSGQEIQNLQVKSHQYQTAIDNSYLQLEGLMAELDKLNAVN